LEISHNDLSERILHLEAASSQNSLELKTSHTNFLQQLADTLNSKKSSNLEPTLQELTKALQAVGFQVEAQRNSQERLSDKIQQVLTAQQVMEVLNSLPATNVAMLSPNTSNE
jgi:DNA-binding transcriptional regulator GbsR (MarR family)